MKFALKCVNTIPFLFLFILYSNYINGQGIISTIAGNGIPGYHGDGGKVDSCELYNPLDISLDTAKNIYISDGTNLRVRKINKATGFITTVAGNGSTMFTADSVAGTATGLDPYGIFADLVGNVYIADVSNNRIRKVNAATGIITTVAGNGTSGFSGDSSLATNAKLYWPTGVYADSAGNLYIADYYNNRIRKVDAISHKIYTIAGNGSAGYAGDGNLAINAELNAPTYVCVDSHGNVYVSDVNNNVIRKIDAVTGNIGTVAGNGTPGFSGDGGLAINAELLSPAGIFVTNKGSLYIADENNDRVRIVSSGYINTIAGGGIGTSIGDGGISTNAVLSGPSGVYVDTSGAMYISDMRHNRIRFVTKPNAVNNVTAAISFRIYPNPSQGIFYLRMNEKRNECSVEICNTVGEKVYQSSIINPVSAIDISDQPNGIYFIELKSEGIVIIEKIIIEK